MAEHTDDSWLRCEGDMADRIRAFDWAATPLGPMAEWPDALRFCLNLLLPSKAQMVLFWGPELRAFYNDAYTPTIGNKHPHVLGRPAREGWAELWDDLGPLLHAVLDRGETISAADRPFKIDRAGYLEDVFFDISYSPVRGPQGEITGALCMVAETTQRVLMHRQLAESETQVRAAAERIELALNAGAVAGTWVWDITADRITADERFARTFALPADKLRRGMPLEEVKQSIHPEDLPQVNEKIVAVLKRGGPYRAEYRVQSPGGNWHWIEANGRAELDAEGRAVRFPGVLIDIDRRREAEAAVRASEERFRALAQALPNHVWTADAAGAFDWVNGRMVEQSGLGEAELQLIGWEALVHPEDTARVAANWRGALTGGLPFEAEARMRGRDGVWRWHLARAIPAHGPAGEQRWVGTNTDIHDHKSAQAMLANLAHELEQRVDERTRALTEAQDTLRQAQKMEAVGQLTGGLAHDFNNLLGTISNAMQILRLRLEQGHAEGLERYLGMADDSVRRAAALTHRLLAFSRRQTLDPKPLTVDRLVQGMEELVRRTMGPAIQIRIEGTDGLWTTRLDASQLENSLLNLCINARDAMPQGGRLTIATANAAVDEAEGRALELAPGDYVTLCVTDSGAGMAPEVKQRIFDPFFTTKPLGLGTGLGLGLSMVYGFVRQSGGQVRVDSEPGRGTTLCLYLPRFDGPAEDEPAQGGARMVPGAGETVVVVEDEQGIRLTVEEVLRESGYRVVAAPDGAAGLALLDAEPEVALLVTDVGLPGGLNGRQLAEIARQRRPELKVLFLTGYDNAAVSDGTLEPGMAVLTKPFELAAFSQRVRSMIEGAGR